MSTKVALVAGALFALAMSAVGPGHADDGSPRTMIARR
jgi:hypothetical protein